MNKLTFASLSALFLSAPAFCEEAAKPAENPDLARLTLHTGTTGAGDVVIVVAVFVFVAAMVWFKHRARVRIAEAQLEAIKALAEKGQPVSSEALRDMGQGEKARKTPVETAITYVALGVACLIYFAAKENHSIFAAAGGAFFLISGLGKYFLAKSK